MQGWEVVNIDASASIVKNDAFGERPFDWPRAADVAWYGTGAKKLGNPIRQLCWSRPELAPRHSYTASSAFHASRLPISIATK